MQHFMHLNVQAFAMSSVTNNSILLTFIYEVEAQELQQSSMTAMFKLQASM